MAGNGTATQQTIKPEQITRSEWNFTVGRGSELLEKLAQMPVKLQMTSRIFQESRRALIRYTSLKTGRDADRVKVHAANREQQTIGEIHLLHLIKGGDSKDITFHQCLILFPYEKDGDGSAALIPVATLKKRYPLTYSYLLSHKAYLENREDGKMKGTGWYAYGRSQALDVMPLPKVFTPDIAARASFSLDETGEIFFSGVAGGWHTCEAEMSRECFGVA